MRGLVGAVQAAGRVVVALAESGVWDPAERFTFYDQVRAKCQGSQDREQPAGWACHLQRSLQPDSARPAHQCHVQASMSIAFAFSCYGVT